MANKVTVNEVFNRAAEDARALPLPANTLAGKKIRTRKCGARLRVPSETPGRETIFTCQLQKHDEATPHQEAGLVHMSNDTVRRYAIQWTDEGVAALRKHMPARSRTTKVRAVK